MLNDSTKLSPQNERRTAIAPEIPTQASYNTRLNETLNAAKDSAAAPGPAPRNGSSSIRTSAMFRALRHRNFQLFFSGQLISLIGTWMQNVAQSWLVYRMTGSAFLLGVVGFAGQIPVFIFAPVGGMVADRMSRQRVVIATQTTSMILAFILAALTLLRVVTVWEIIVLAASLGIVNAFDIPARQAFLGDMVGRDDLMNAIALNSSMFNGARVIGPAVAGVLVAWIGEGWCFFANAVSYIAVIAGLLMMRLAPFLQPGDRRVSVRTHGRRLPLRDADEANSRAAAASRLHQFAGAAV